MAQVLALYYSLTHQNEAVMKEITAALEKAGHEVTLEPIRPVNAFPLPSNAGVLLGLLKDAVSQKWPNVELGPIRADLDRPYDLLLIGYQPWYMTPSVPVHSFLKSAQARVVRRAPVVGIVTCRAMFDRACGLFQRWVEDQGGKVVEQRVFVDQDTKGTNMVSLVHYLRNGKDPEKGPLKYLLKPFGVGAPGLAKAREYGEQLAIRLNQGKLEGSGEVVAYTHCKC